MPITGRSGAHYSGVWCPLLGGQVPIIGVQVPIIGGSGAHYREVRCALLGGQVPITGGGRCPLWGGQVLIIGGSGAYYRGFRCQLWGCQEPMTGASGAHHRGMWRWCEALELDTNMPLTTSRVKHVNEPYSALSQPPSSPSNRYSFCASSSHCVTYTTRQFASLNSVSGLISKIERDASACIRRHQAFALAPV